MALPIALSLLAPHLPERIDAAPPGLVFGGAGDEQGRGASEGLDDVRANRGRDDVGQERVDLFGGVQDGCLVLLDPRLPLARFQRGVERLLGLRVAELR